MRYYHAQAGVVGNHATTRGVIRVFRRGLGVVTLCSGLALAAAAVPAVAAAQSPTYGGPAAQATGTVPVGYTPAQLQAAYALPSLNYGTGTTVAVVAPFDDPDVAGDLAAYREQFGEPACAQTLSVTAPQCLTVISESGALIAPGSHTAPAANTSWALTTSTQLDAISAVCPNCHLLLVEVNSPAIPDVGAGVNFAADLGAKAITIGVAQPETSNETFWDTEYFDHPGVAITAAAGDVAGGASGYSPNGVDYPAASQYVIAVGGTSLAQAGTGSCTTASAGSRGWCETAWNDSDGASVSGCSLYEPEPAWQSAGLSPVSDTGCGAARTVVDVSADADPATGIAVYDSYGEGDWQTTPVGGTAVAAAIVAGADALAGTPASDVDPASYLYANETYEFSRSVTPPAETVAYVSGFNDITSGSNGTCSPAPSYLCAAGLGYDAPTGLGSPDGDSVFLSSFYQSVTPALVLNTGTGLGTNGAVGSLAAGGTLALQVTGTAGVPSANVTAVAVNLTATGETKSGAIVAYPDGSAPPGTSTLDYAAGTDVANLAIVPVGADGKIDLHNESAGTTGLLAGIYGYFTSDSTAAGDTTYRPYPPTRILDTRNGTGAPKAKLTPGSSPLAVQIGGAGGIPSGVSAVAINLAAVNDSGNGNLVAWADGTARPNVAAVQFNHGRDVAAMTIVPVGADGKIDIAEPDGTSTDVIGDVSGYFSTGTGGEMYHAITATRLVDTRTSTAVPSDGILTVTPGAAVVAPLPDLIVNVTVTEPASSGNLGVYGYLVPVIFDTSNVNFATGETIANLALADTGDDGTVNTQNAMNIHNNSGGTLELVVDCLGYFSPG